MCKPCRRIASNEINVFNDFIHIGSNATAKHSSPAEREGARNRYPCPAGYMGDTLPHAVRVGIIRTKQKGVFMHPTPSFCQKMAHPPCQNRKKFFNFKKSHSSSWEVCYTYRKKGGIKNGQSRCCSHACGFCA